MPSIPKLKALIEALHHASGEENVQKKVCACMELLDKYCLLKRNPSESQKVSCRYAAAVIVLSPGKFCGEPLRELLECSPLAQMLGVSRGLPKPASDLLWAKLHIWKTQKI